VRRPHFIVMWPPRLPYLVANIGLRIGELLKLTLDDLPRGPNHALTMIRRPDGPADVRANELEIKTNERALLVPPPVRSLLAEYRTAHRRSTLKYLFVTQTGRLLSMRRALDIIEELSDKSGVR